MVTRRRVSAGHWPSSPSSGRSRRPRGAGAATVGTGTHPWVVVLCNFSDEPATPYSKAYFEELFSDAGARQARRSSTTGMTSPSAR